MSEGQSSVVDGLRDVAFLETFLIPHFFGNVPHFL